MPQSCAFFVALATVHFCSCSLQTCILVRQECRYTVAMKTSQIKARLDALPNKRAFAKLAGLNDRTVWRIIAGHDNFTQATKAKLEQALRAEKRLQASK